jgi:hypothetical protein
MCADVKLDVHDSFLGFDFVVGFVLWMDLML